MYIQVLCQTFVVSFHLLMNIMGRMKKSFTYLLCKLTRSRSRILFCRKTGETMLFNFVYRFISNVKYLHIYSTYILESSRPSIRPFGSLVAIKSSSMHKIFVYKWRACLGMYFFLCLVDTPIPFLNMSVACYISLN